MPLVGRMIVWVASHGSHLIFVLVWLTITVASMVAMTSALGRATVRAGHAATPASSAFSQLGRDAGSPKAARGLGLLLVFLIFYVAMSLVWEDFAYYDNSQLTLLTLQGHNFWMQIDPTSGRFWPFGLQEFNIIRHFTNTVNGYHVLPIVEIFLFSVIVVVLTDELSIPARVTLAILTLLTPSIVFCLNSLVFVERNVLFLLACMALCVKRFEHTRSIVWPLAAILCTQIMLYSKETAFLLILGFAGSRLVLRLWVDTSAGRWIDRLWSKESSLDLCLAVLAVIFLLYYLVLMGMHGKMTYVDKSRLPRTQTIMAYLKIDLLPYLLIVVVLARSCLMLGRQITPLLLWDGLAFAGLLWYLGYLYNGLFSVYYTGPVDFIAVLYIGRFILLAPSRSWPSGKIMMILLAFVIFAQDFLVSSFVVFERKNVIRAKSEIASVVKAQYLRDQGKDLTLFFPYAGGYVIMEFAAYLNHLGVPVAGAHYRDAGDGPAEQAVGAKRVSLVDGRAQNSLGRPPEDGFCVNWIGFWCRALRAPAPGDLVIVLPDDGASMAQAAKYRGGGDLLLSYEPRPRLPRWLYWFFSRLPVGPEGRYRDDMLPDRWMNASVTKWK